MRGATGSTVCSCIAAVTAAVLAFAPGCGIDMGGRVDTVGAGDTAARLASEKGRATPTRNENDGWMKSCSEAPTHSTCDWCHARKRHHPLSGSACATRFNRSTSAIISNITKPR